MPFPIAAAAPVIGSLLSGIFARSSQSSANRTNIKLAREQQAWNEHMWKLNNQYNHPSKQMARLQEAGLNPNMIYGTSPSSAVGASGAPAKSYDRASVDSLPIPEFENFFRFRNQAAQTDNLQAQNDVLVQEAALKGLKGAQTAADTARSKFDLQLAKELKSTSLQAAEQNVRNIEARTIGQEIQNSTLSKTQKSVVREAFYRAENARENLTGQKRINELRKLEIELKRIGIERNDPWYFRIFGRGLNKTLKDGAPFDSFGNFK